MSRLSGVDGAPREAPSCWPCSSRGPAIQLLAPQKALVVTFRLGRAEGARERDRERQRAYARRQDEDGHEEEEARETERVEERSEAEREGETEIRGSRKRERERTDRSAGVCVSSAVALRCVCVCRVVCRRKYYGEREGHGRIIFSLRKRPMNNAPEPPMCRTVR